MLETLHRKKHLTSFQFIILGFAGIIFVGALLLMLPISSATGTITPFNEPAQCIQSGCIFQFFIP